MSANSLRSDVQLFEDATRLAEQRAYWRERAAQGGSGHFTRRQCLLNARWQEARIVDIAIHVETFRCRPEARS